MIKTRGNEGTLLFSGKKEAKKPLWWIDLGHLLYFKRVGAVNQTSAFAADAIISVRQSNDKPNLQSGFSLLLSFSQKRKKGSSPFLLFSPRRVPSVILLIHSARLHDFPAEPGVFILRFE